MSRKAWEVHIVRISLAFVAGGLIENLIFMLLNLDDFWHIYQPPSSPLSHIVPLS